MPLISRDEIKEFYVNTYGLKHDELPANITARGVAYSFRINEPCWMQSVAQ